MSPSRASVRVLTRGAVVGAVATIADIVALASFVHAGVPAARASLPALAIGVAVQFVGSKLFTFEDRSRAWVKQGVLFVLVEVVSFALNLLFFDVGLRLAPHVPIVPLRLVTTSLVYAAVSLPLWSLVFSRRGAQ